MLASMNKLRLGYVGCGFMAQKVHLPNFSSLPNCALVALAEVRPDILLAVGDAYGIEHRFASHQQMADWNGLDAVAISGHYAQQGELAIDFLRRGIPVFMEKPMAVSVAQGQRILAAAKEGGTRLMIGYMKRSDAGNLLARDLIREFRCSGELGRITFIRNHGFGGDWLGGLDNPFFESKEAMPPASVPAPAWLPQDRVNGYVGYLQQYTHNLNLIRWLLDDAQPLKCRSADFEEDGISGVAVLEAGGVRVSLESGYLNYPGWDEHTQVYFEHGWVKTAAPAAAVAQRAGDRGIVPRQAVLRGLPAYSRETLQLVVQGGGARFRELPAGEPALRRLGRRYPCRRAGVRGYLPHLAHLQRRNRMKFRTTRTGSYRIGFRRGWSDWQKDLPALIAWARENGFGLIDLGSDADVSAPLVRDAGLEIGSADLGSGQDWAMLLSADADRRKQAVEKIGKYVAACTRFGIKNFFCVLIPEDPKLERRKNLDYAIESFLALEPVLLAGGAKIVVEGWPGAGSVCCTPEAYRAFFAACSSTAFGVNYDPSHLMRMWIDPVRFLREFQERVFHVHGKDTEVDLQAVYELGVELPPVVAPIPAFGGTFWRYTIPGAGQCPWGQIFSILTAANYAGGVSIELEDAAFNGTPEGEKRGLLAGASFLESV